MLYDLYCSYRGNAFELATASSKQSGEADPAAVLINLKEKKEKTEYK